MTSTGLSAEMSLRSNYFNDVDVFSTASIPSDYEYPPPARWTLNSIYWSLRKDSPHQIKMNVYHRGGEHEELIEPDNISQPHLKFYSGNDRWIDLGVIPDNMSNTSFHHTIDEFHTFDCLDLKDYDPGEVEDEFIKMMETRKQQGKYYTGGRAYFTSPEIDIPFHSRVLHSYWTVHDSFRKGKLPRLYLSHDAEKIYITDEGGSSGNGALQYTGTEVSMHVAGFASEVNGSNPSYENIQQYLHAPTSYHIFFAPTGDEGFTVLDNVFFDDITFAYSAPEFPIFFEWEEVVR